MLMKQEPATLQEQRVGIDISMEKFDVAITAADGKTAVQQFSMKKKGLNEFRCWLRKQGVNNPSLWLEATGRYWERLALFAKKNGWKVIALNPRSVRHFAISKLNMNKTDKADAMAILRFAEDARDGEYRVWEEKTEAAKALRDLQVELLGLKKALTAERNRLKCGLTSEYVKTSIRMTIESLKARKLDLEKESLRVIKCDPTLKADYDVLKKVRGLGDISVCFLLAKIDFSAFSKGRQVVKYAGLDVIQYESGKSVKKRNRISRVGHAEIRSALYWPAIVAMRFDQATSEFAAKIAERSCRMVAICAVMARLLRVAFAKLRDEHKKQREEQEKQLAQAAA